MFALLYFYITNYSVSSGAGKVAQALASAGGPAFTRACAAVGKLIYSIVTS